MRAVWAAIPGRRATSLSQKMVAAAFSFTHYPAVHPANALEQQCDIRVTFCTLAKLIESNYITEGRAETAMKPHQRPQQPPKRPLHKARISPQNADFCPLLCLCFAEAKFLRHLSSCSARQTSGDIWSSQHRKSFTFRNRMQIIKVWLYDV